MRSSAVRLAAFPKQRSYAGLFLRSRPSGRTPIGARSAVSSPAPPSPTTAGASNGGPSERAATEQSWSEEWRRIGLGARLPPPGARITNLLFVQTGFGVDQHGDRSREGATRAAVRAVRNAIEFNAIPGAIEAVPGGRSEMLIRVKLGVPPAGGDGGGGDSEVGNATKPMAVDLSHVAKVFPYGRLMPIEVVVGGLSFPTGRVVCELGDEDDIAICVAASVSIGYDERSLLGDQPKKDDESSSPATYHKTYSTKDGY